MPRGKLDAFYRLVRPYALIGTVATVILPSLLAVEKMADISPLFLTRLIQALAASILMHVYCAGMNQVFDLEIDKVNKPYLPLASGDISVKSAVILSAFSATMSLWLVWIVGSVPLSIVHIIYFVFATGYSVNGPLLRWKRFQYGPVLCIAVSQLVQLGYYLHMQTFALGRPAFFSIAVIFSTTIMTTISVVQAIFKDIPDIEGDRLGGIKTLAIQLGPKKVFWISVGLLQIAYFGAVLVGLTSPYNWAKFILVSGHLFLAWILWRHAKIADVGSKTSMQSSYMFIWKLYYAEYFLILLVR